MADRVLDRAFNRVYGSTHAKAAKPVQKEEKTAAAAEPEEADSQREVKHILSAWKDKDHFRLLHLPRPTIDALDRPTWSCSNDDVSRAYRRLSRLVHPDKCPGEEARSAFEALNKAHRELKDASKLEEILKAAAEKAKEEAERQEARATVTERIQLNANKNVQARSLRAQEGSNFREEILQQMRKRQEDVNRKQQARSRRRREDNKESEQDESKDEVKARSSGPPLDKSQPRGNASDEEEGVVKLVKKRKKPTFI